MSEPNQKIKRTKNYKMFKTLLANRDVRNARVNKIIDSIKRVGYITNPIIVNEKYEVIDGQGRLEALKELNLPVDYIIVNGIGIEECRAMNIQQSNWTGMEFIKSYSDEGRASYRWLYTLIQKYPRVQYNAVLAAIAGGIIPAPKTIRSGGFHCEQENYELADMVLEFENRFVDIITQVTGRKDYFLIALGFAYANCEIDEQRMVDILHKNIAKLDSCDSIEQTLDSISEIYNYRFKGNKIYLSHDYKRWLDEKKIVKRPRKTSYSPHKGIKRGPH